MRARLPKNRFVLRAGFLGGILPAYLVLATFGSGCGCDGGMFDFFDLWDFFLPEPGESYVVPGFEGETNWGYQNRDDRVVFEGNKTTPFVDAEFYQPLYIPKGRMTFQGEDYSGGMYPLPPTINFGVELFPEPPSRTVNDPFSVGLEFKDGILAPTEAEFPGLMIEPGDRVLLTVKPSGESIVREHFLHIEYNLTPSIAALRPLLATYGGVLPALYENDQLRPGIMPTAPLRVQVKAGSKLDLFRITFGTLLEIPRSNLEIGGGFAGDVDAKVALPKKIIVYGDHLDENGKKQSRVKIILKVKNGAIRTARKSIPGWDIFTGHMLKLWFKVKGGTLEPEHGLYLTVQMFSS